MARQSKNDAGSSGSATRPGRKPFGHSPRGAAVVSMAIEVLRRAIPPIEDDASDPDAIHFRIRGRPGDCAVIEMNHQDGVVFELYVLKGELTIDEISELGDAREIIAFNNVSDAVRFRFSDAERVRADLRSFFDQFL